MSTRFTSTCYPSTVAHVTSTAGITIGPIDVRSLDRFSLMYQNANTAIGTIHVSVQGAYDSSAAFENAGTSGTGCPNFVAINSSLLPYPSAIGPSASVLTSSVYINTLAYIRVIVSTCAVAPIGSFRVFVGGFQRSN